ncbi:MAG: FAD-binding oxidoreductase, partial [Chloroflexota bacterium]
YLTEIFLGAKYCATDGTANPLLVSRALGWAAQRLGAKILTHTEALRIEIQGHQVTSVLAKDRQGEFVIETPQVIHAGGPWTPHLSQNLGVGVPIVPARSSLAITQRMPRLFDEFVSSHDLGVYARQAREGQIHIGRSVSELGETFDQTTPLSTIENLARGAAQLIPALRGANFLRTWTGTLENTPDGIAIISAVDSIAGYLIAAGFSGHGFCLGPIAGKLLSEWLVEGEPSMSLREFRLARFQK